MKLTTLDVEHLFEVRARAQSRPVQFEQLRDMIERQAMDEMMKATEMCRLSNGWLVMYSYEYQRPEVLCHHVTVCFMNQAQATVYAVSRIMEIMQFRYPFKRLASWQDHNQGPFALCVHVVEPIDVSIEDFSEMVTNDHIAQAMSTGAAL